MRLVIRGQADGGDGVSVRSTISGIFALFLGVPGAVHVSFGGETGAQICCK